MGTEVRTRGADQIKEVIRGQGGTPVAVNESRFVADQAILDPNSDLAVQIPEGVGADTTMNRPALADTLAEGHVEAKFGTAAAGLATGPDVSEDPEQPTAEHEPDWDRIDSPPIHNKPALQRALDNGEAVQDVEADSPASSRRPAEEDAEADE